MVPSINVIFSVPTIALLAAPKLTISFPLCSAVVNLTMTFSFVSTNYDLSTTTLIKDSHYMKLAFLIYEYDMSINRRHTKYCASISTNEDFLRFKYLQSPRLSELNCLKLATVPSTNLMMSWFSIDYWAAPMLTFSYL